MSSSRSFFKDTFTVLVTKLFNMGAGLAASFIIARSLGLEGTALYTVAFATINMINGITSLGMNRSLTVLYPKPDTDKRALIGNAITMYLLSTLIAVGVVAGMFAAGPVQRQGWTEFLPALASIPFMLLIDYTNGIFLAKGMIKEFNGSQLRRYAGFLAGLLLTIYALKLGNISVTLSFLLGTILGATVAVGKLWSELRVRPLFDRTYVGRIFSLGIQFAIAAFVVQLNYRVAVLFLESNVDFKLVGIFGLAISLAEVIWQIPNSIATVVIAKSATTTEEEAIRRTTQLLRVALPLTVLAGLILSTLAGPLTILFFGEKLKAAGPGGLDTAITAIRTLIPGVVFGVIYKVLQADLAGRGEPLFAARAYAFAVAANIIACIMLVGQFKLGTYGAALASSAGHIVGGVLFLIAYLRRYKIPAKDALLMKRSDFGPVMKKLARLRS
jgi:O-antigen/teichoic acid export membrane protein